MPQLSLSGRVVTAVASSQGMIKYAHAGDTVWHSPTNATTTPMLDIDRLNFASANVGSLWFVDGINYRVFDATTTTVSAWTASAGSLPTAGGTIPELTETWRGRTCLFGMKGDPYDWFMSAIGNPRDFDYAPGSPSPAQAVAGSAGPQGKIADIITGFAPYTDDIAFLGCNNSLYLFNGDPQANGQIDLVSDRIGMAWGRAWTKDAYGNLYFFSNRCGIYSVTPGQQPQRISQQVDQSLFNLNMGENSVSMAWDDRQQGFHVFITEVEDAAATTHLFWEWRSNSWFKDVFSNPNHNPLCACQFDGNNPEDRVVLIGSWDGVVRYLDPNAQNDDGRIIQSSVLIGPMQSSQFATLDEFLLTEIQGILGNDSGLVTWNILLGDTPEQALLNPVQATGTFSGGRNPTALVRRASHAIYIQLTSEVPWRMEQIRAIIRVSGRIRRRSRF